MFRGFSRGVSKYSPWGGFLAAAFIFLMAASVVSPAAEAAEKRIPYKWIPRKRIPKQSRYFQAPAFKNRARRNRRLVTKARRSNRQLRRTGTAYDIGGR